MPLIGIIDQKGTELSWDEYVAGNGHVLYPTAVRAALRGAIDKQRNRWLSVTTTLYCMRKAKWEYESDYYLKEENAYYLMRGNLLHTILSSQIENQDDIKNNKVLIEYELKYKVPGCELPLGGQLDRWERGTLYDYKTMSDNGIHIIKKSGAKEEYVWQANIYKYMLNKVLGVVTDKIVIVFLTMSKLFQTGTEMKIFDQKKQKEDTFKIPACPIYPDDQVETFLKSKLDILNKRTEPIATPQDWLCGGCYFKVKCHKMIGDGSAVVAPSGELF